MFNGVSKPYTGPTIILRRILRAFDAPSDVLDAHGESRPVEDIV